jgi:hypothetical protein
MGRGGGGWCAGHSTAVQLAGKCTHMNVLLYGMALELILEMIKLCPLDTHFFAF